MTARSLGTAAETRQREIAWIHIGAKQLRMDRDTYEAMLLAIGRVRSSKDLDWAGRRKVLDHLAHLGWRPGFNRESPRIRKLLALWGALHRLGAVEDRSVSALSAFCRRQTGVDHIRFLDRQPKSLATLTESLKSWLARVERDRERPETDAHE